MSDGWFGTSMRSFVDEEIESSSAEGVSARPRIRRRPTSSERASFTSDMHSMDLCSMLDEMMESSTTNDDSVEMRDEEAKNHPRDSSNPDAARGNEELSDSGSSGSARRASCIDSKGSPVESVSATLMSSIANLLNTLAGAGMLGLPGAFAGSGFVGGAVLLVAACFFSTIGLRLLAESIVSVGIRSDRPSSFHLVASSALPHFTVLIDIAVALKCFGVMVSYLMTVGDCMVDAFRYLLRHFAMEGHPWEETLTSRHLWIATAILLAVPLSFYRTLDALKLASFLSLLLKFALSVGVILYAEDILNPCKGYEDFTLVKSQSVLEDEQVGCQGETELVTTFEPTVRSLTVFVFAFTCHQNIFPVMNEMATKTPARVACVLFSTTGTALMVYMIVGIEGYRAYGSRAHGDILLNYPSTALLTTMRIFLAVVLILTYPLQVDPARRCINGLVQSWQQSSFALTMMDDLSDEICRQEMENLRDEDDFASINGDLPFPNKCSNGDRKPQVEDGCKVGVGRDVSASDSSEGPTTEGTATSACLFNAITCTLLILSFACAMLVSDLGMVLSVVGATGSTVVTYILPGAIYIKLHPAFHFLKFLAYLQLMLGIILIPLALYSIFSQEMTS